MAYPNPLFDTSFKITMQDPEIANQVLSALLSKKVTLLHQSPQDYQLKAESRGGSQRLDYIGIIDDNGECKKVMIELQRIRHVADYQRFRRYLGFQMMVDSDIEFQYSSWSYFAKKSGLDDSNEAYKKQIDSLSKNGALEIITVYLLNFEIGIELSMFESPDYFIDCWTKKPTIKKRADSEFCRLLQHKMYVVQFPLMEKVLDTVGQKTGVKNLRDLMYFWLTGANDDAYLLQENDRTFEGLAQTVYKKLHDSYEKDEKVRFSLMDEAKTEQETQVGLIKAAEKLAQEKIEKVEKSAQEKIEKAKEAEHKAKEAEHKAKEAERQTSEELQKSKINFAKKLIKYGESIEDIILATQLSETEVLKLTKNKK